MLNVLILTSARKVADETTREGVTSFAVAIVVIEVSLFAAAALFEIQHDIAMASAVREVAWCDTIGAAQTKIAQATHAFASVIQKMRYVAVVVLAASICIALAVNHQYKLGFR